jgi:hypothetical protein
MRCKVYWHLGFYQAILYLCEVKPAANTDLFIANSGGSDWVGANVDSNGSKRADAWVDGGSNDICPAVSVFK